MRKGSANTMFVDANKGVKMNISQRLQRNKALFAAVTAFLVAFIILLLIGYALQARVNTSAEYKAAAQSVQQMAETGNMSQVREALTVFRNGGQLSIGGQATQNLPPLAKHLHPFKFDIDSLARDLDKPWSEVATQFAQLSTAVTEKNDKQKKLFATMMIVAAIVTFLLYFVLLVPLFLRRGAEEETTKTAVKETEGIMNTVSEGLFLLSSDHQIGVEQSASLKKMFKLERDLEGNFFDFISDYVTQDNVRVAKDYLNLLYGDRVKEKLVEDLNPLNNVEISLVRRDGQYENRYLDFRFKRVMVDGEINHLLGSVTDVTKQVKLEQQLAEVKEEQEAQVDLLMSILHIDGNKLRRFIDNSDAALEKINERLKERGHGDTEIRRKLVDITGEAHKLKGDAATLGLHKFEFDAHAFEEELEKARNSEEKLTGKHLLPAITKLRDLFAELERMNALIERFSDAMGSQGTGIGSINSESESPVDLDDSVFDEVDSLLDQEDSVNLAASLSTDLNNLCSTVAERNNVPVDLDLSELNSDVIPDHLAEPVNDMLVQLLRNSIVHGYDGAEQRSERQKPESLQVNVGFNVVDGEYVLNYRDDGKGLDPEAILEKAVEKSLITSQAAAGMNQAQAVQLLFRSGFSTLDDASLDGGRGVGLDVVAKRIRDAAGRISVRSKVNKFSKFTISFPEQTDS